jgi:hypothetical protein
VPDDTPSYYRDVPCKAFRNNAFPIKHLDGQGSWVVRGPNGAEYNVKAFLDTKEDIWWFHLDGDSRIAWWKKR